MDHHWNCRYAKVFKYVVSGMEGRRVNGREGKREGDEGNWKGEGDEGDGKSIYFLIKPIFFINPDRI